MAIVYVLLATGIFSLNLFLTIKYGSEHPLWFWFVILAMFGIIFFDSSEFGLYFALLFLFAFILSNLISVRILKKRAGKRMLTFREVSGKPIWGLLYSGFFFYVAFRFGFPNQYNFPNGMSLFDTEFFRINLPGAILMSFLGVSNLLAAFEKNEFFETGMIGSNSSFLPWNGYKAYEWVEYAKGKDKKRFLLFLEGAYNASLSIDGLSEQDKIILEELLFKKLPQVNPSS